MVTYLLNTPQVLPTALVRWVPVQVSINSLLDDDDVYGDNDDDDVSGDDNDDDVEDKR